MATEHGSPRMPVPGSSFPLCYPSHCHRSNRTFAFSRAVLSQDTVVQNTTGP